jgi:hypothetical protein
MRRRYSLGAHERTGRGMLHRATGTRVHEKAKEHLSAQSKKAESQRPLLQSHLKEGLMRQRD